MLATCQYMLLTTGWSILDQIIQIFCSYITDRREYIYTSTYVGLRNFIQSNAHVLVQYMVVNLSWNIPIILMLVPNHLNPLILHAIDNIPVPFERTIMKIPSCAGSYSDAHNLFFLIRVSGSPRRPVFVSDLHGFSQNFTLSSSDRKSVV